MGRLTVLICDSPFHHESVDEALEISREALKQGHSVELFLMMDGVYSAYKKQSGEPFKVEAVHERLKNLVNSGARVNCCRVCMELRGLTEEEIPEGVELSGLFDLSESIAEADTVLTFAGGG